MFTQTQLLVKISPDWLNLQEYLYFNSNVYGNLRTMTGSDGISDPTWLQVFLERFGEYLYSGIIHDGAYKNNLEQQQTDGTWTKLTLTETQANGLIDECMKSQGASWIKRELVYDALQLFGWKAFDDDRTTPPSPPLATVALHVQR
jgi:hypothetical protein